uniref:TetR family transcriptional regulator n=1 Tax=Streptomyces sp. NBC_01393 TaxID=2903851 RepID=A0AAU3IFR1_9ACTN
MWAAEVAAVLRDSGGPERSCFRVADAASGDLEPGTDPQDVLLRLSVLWGISPGEGAEARAARILDLVLDGLRTRPGGS